MTPTDRPDAVSFRSNGDQPDYTREDRDYEARQDRAERDRIDPAWCPECQAMVQPTRQDHGIDVHHEWVIACPDCECTKLEESQPQEDEA